MDLKNMDMAQLKEKLLAVADKKTLIKFGIGFGSIVLFLIIYYAILNPMVKDRKVKFDDKVKKQNEISQFNSEIIQLKADLEKMNPEFKKSSTLFHSKAEVEGLYNSLSIYAANNGLVISRIAKQKPIPVLKDGVSVAQNLIEKNMISYYKIPVVYEIKGKFLGFIKFKRAVSRSNKMLNFDKEIVSVVQGDSTGTIVAQGELTIVGLPDEFF
jgi:Tfp pilus assembly protein PilO|tara:strand:- start:3211 stop:3849 length:639 start_codon:yes stop_codon:yes gene_type:complete